MIQTHAREQRTMRVLKKTNNTTKDRKHRGAHKFTLGDPSYRMWIILTLTSMAWKKIDPSSPAATTVMIGDLGFDRNTFASFLMAWRYVFFLVVIS